MNLRNRNIEADVLWALVQEGGLATYETVCDRVNRRRPEHIMQATGYLLDEHSIENVGSCWRITRAGRRRCGALRMETVQTELL